ncbi:hypothetical protein V8G54_013670 [Vigna mungo]|uniref:Transposase (putative) gypsy type domain-containing protein n=1 Tax=Vigna mungo TaxID=3915 RepID=A0AAQ3NG88_VIGMU
MASSPTVHALSDSDNRNRDDPSSSCRRVVGSVELLLSGDKVFVNGGVEVEDSGQECASCSLDYSWASREACRKGERVFHGEEVAGEGCFYIYLCLFHHMYVRLPFTRFQMEVLKYLNVAPSQLHPNSWAYIQAFGVLCQALGINPTAKIFLYFFKSRPNAKKGWISLSSKAKDAIFNLFAESFKDFKNHFFKVSIKSRGKPFFLNDDGSSKFPLYWTRKP